MTRFILLTGAFLLVPMFSMTQADLVPGVLSNFQDGTAQGWSGGTVVNVSDSGPLGTGDHSVRLSNGGPGQNFAMFNTGINGVISPFVGSISSDIFRPLGLGSAEIRLVLFDINSTRWTSTNAVTVSDDGLWHGYTFSILESALTRVAGTEPYSTLTGNLERILFRFDPGTPSSGGSALNGTMNFDNIVAIPEPTSAFLLASAVIVGGFRRRRCC